MAREFDRFSAKNFVLIGKESSCRFSGPQQLVTTRGSVAKTVSSNRDAKRRRSDCLSRGIYKLRSEECRGQIRRCPRLTCRRFVQTGPIPTELFGPIPGARTAKRSTAGARSVTRRSPGGPSSDTSSNVLTRTCPGKRAKAHLVHRSKRRLLRKGAEISQTMSSLKKLLPNVPPSLPHSLRLLKTNRKQAAFYRCEFLSPNDSVRRASTSTSASTKRSVRRSACGS